MWAIKFACVCVFVPGSMRVAVLVPGDVLVGSTRLTGQASRLSRSN